MVRALSIAWTGESPPAGSPRGGRSGSGGSPARRAASRRRSASGCAGNPPSATFRALGEDDQDAEDQEPDHRDDHDHLDATQPGDELGRRAVRLASMIRFRDTSGVISRATGSARFPVAPGPDLTIRALHGRPGSSAPLPGRLRRVRPGPSPAFSNDRSRCWRIARCSRPIACFFCEAYRRRSNQSTSASASNVMIRPKMASQIPRKNGFGAKPTRSGVREPTTIPSASRQRIESPASVGGRGGRSGRDRRPSSVGLPWRSSHSRSPAAQSPEEPPKPGRGWPVRCRT